MKNAKVYDLRAWKVDIDGPEKRRRKWRRKKRFEAFAWGALLWLVGAAMIWTGAYVLVQVVSLLTGDF